VDHEKEDPKKDEISPSGFVIFFFTARLNSNSGKYQALRDANVTIAKRIAVIKFCYILFFARDL
jgi:hypothetical protein